MGIRQVPTSIKDATVAGYLRELRNALSKVAAQVAAPQPKTVTVTNVPTPTPTTPTPLVRPTVVLTVSPTTPQPGETFTLTAVVTGDSPTGTVSFLEGVAELAGSPVAIDAGKASLPVVVATKSNHTYIATYSGDTRNSAATSNSLAVVVGAGGPDGLPPPPPYDLTATPDNWAINLAWQQVFTVGDPNYVECPDYLETEIWAQLTAPAWDSGTRYYTNNLVSYNDHVYQAIKGTDTTPTDPIDNTNHLPTDTAWWKPRTDLDAIVTATAGTNGVKVGSIAGLNYNFSGFGSHLLSPDERWTFWIRNADIEGLFSTYAGPVTATTLITPEKALDLLAGSIRDTQLYRDLANDVNALRGQWTVKVTDGDWLVGGIGLGVTAVGGVPTLDFGVRADRFWVASPVSKDLTKVLVELDATNHIVVQTYTTGGETWGYFLLPAGSDMAAFPVGGWFMLKDVFASYAVDAALNTSLISNSFFVHNVDVDSGLGQATWPLVPDVPVGDRPRLVFFQFGNITASTGYSAYTPLPEHKLSARVIPPGNIPFVVTTTARTYNGVTLDPGVYMSSAWIMNATITEAKIADAAITNAKIGGFICSTNFLSSGGEVTDNTLTTGAGTTGWAVNKAGQFFFGASGAFSSTIQSSNFDGATNNIPYGTEGWQINADGNAYFNTVIARTQNIDTNAVTNSGGYGSPSGGDNITIGTTEVAFWTPNQPAASVRGTLCFNSTLSMTSGSGQAISGYITIYRNSTPVRTAFFYHPPLTGGVTRMLLPVSYVDGSKLTSAITYSFTIASVGADFILNTADEWWVELKR